MGDAGASGTAAARTVLIWTGESPPPAGVSSSRTTVASEAAVALATSAASWGDSSVAVTSMSAVSSGESARTRCASEAASSVRPSSSTTGSSTRGLVASSTYDLTWRTVKLEPWSRSVVVSEPCTDTYTWDRAAYDGVARSEYAPASTSPSAATTTTLTHLLRSSST
ncbi:hypothetical protein L603_001000000650 [Cellulosimicrobium cellulans J34]|nr:hypothetical protein L603_001000000650 [Cellulosimicrobium cellulans J34]